MSGGGALFSAEPEPARLRRSTRRSYVLRTSADFDALLRSGSRIASRSFVLRAAPNGFGHARLGIIAGRKTAPRAVDRNRAKRLIREAFRAAREKLRSYDIAIQLRRDVRGDENAAVRGELVKLLEACSQRISPGADKQA